MHERTQQEKDNQIITESAGSVKDLKNKISASQAGDANTQRATTQKELEGLRKRTVTAPVAATSNQTAKSTTQKAVEELRGVSHVAAMRQSLFTKPVSAEPAVNLQKQKTLEDLKTLKAAEGHVRAKAKEIEVFFTQSRKVLDVVKTNKVSEAAKVKFTLPQELKVFENQQGEFIAEVKQQLEQDIRQYSEDPKLRELGYAKFLELAFVYRSYEVCLEQDLRRHAARRLKESKVNLTPEGKQRLELLSGIPSQMAVESLNYYGDFYKNLTDIEKIWPHAGILLRKAELRSTFGAKISTSLELLLAILGDKKSEEYILARSLFDNEFAEFIKKNAFISEYIEKGDGLDAANHPWGRYGFNRLAQPNTSINFKDVVFIDNVHADAVHEVEHRVEADRVLVLPRLG